MRGRKPKPTALRVIEGNRERRPLPKDEPRPEPGIPACPKGLNQEARREWRRIVKELRDLKLLTRVDKGALSCYCLAWSRLLEAEKHLEAEGAVVDGRQDGKVKNPWATIANQAMDQIRKLGAEFGLTPSSRGRLHVPRARERTLEEIAAERAEAARARAKLPS